MTNLGDKEKAYENKFAHEQEMAFKLQAKRNKLLGLWVADKLGLAASAREAYAKGIAAHMEKNDADLLAQVKKDLETAGIRLTDTEIREQLYRCQQEAKKDLSGNA